MSNKNKVNRRTTKKDDIDLILTAFLKSDENTSARFGKYHVDKGRLVFRDVCRVRLYYSTLNITKLHDACVSGSVSMISPSLTELTQIINGELEQPSHRLEFDVLVEDVVARRIVTARNEVLLIGNSSSLKHVNASYGNYRVNRPPTDIQVRLVNLGIPMVPFNVFEEAKLNLDHIRIIDRGPEQKVTRKTLTGKIDKKTDKEIFKLEQVHFTGASLYQINDSYFLFDIDRREIKHKIFNAFLVKLPYPVKSIVEAYEALKPDEVKRAETQGIKVLRQGEWFLVPVDAKTSRKCDSLKGTKHALQPITLRAGNNRPNEVKGLQFYNGELVADAPGTVRADWRTVRENSECIVTGTMTHAGREHQPLVLKGWYKAFPNTAIGSFTITGDVD